MTMRIILILTDLNVSLYCELGTCRLLIRRRGLIQILTRSLHHQLRHHSIIKLSANRLLKFVFYNPDFQIWISLFQFFT